MSSTSVPQDLRPVPGSPLQTPGQDRTAFVAAGKFPRFEPPARPLVGAQKDRIEEILSVPRDLASLGNIEAAKKAYLRIINEEGQSKEKIHRILYVVCYVELAGLYEPDSYERLMYAKNGHMAWTNIFEKGILGDELITHFGRLQSCYDKLLQYQPIYEASLKEQMATYQKHFNLWQNFSRLVAAAAELRGTDVKQSTLTYLDAVSLIKDETAPFYLLQKAKCLIKFAQLQKGNGNGTLWGLRAKDLAFDIVERRKSVDLSDLAELLKDLETFYNDELFVQLEISTQLQTVQIELDLQKAKDDEASIEDSREVSQEREDRGLTRLFMLILVLGACIGAAAFLYRRHVIKMN